MVAREATNTSPALVDGLFMILCKARATIGCISSDTLNVREKVS